MPVDALYAESCLGVPFTSYNEWKTIWIEPATRAVHEHRFADAQALLEAARLEQQTGALAEDVREALGYLLLFMHCRCNWHSDCYGYTQQDYDEMLARFSAPAATSFGDCIRRMYLVHIRCNGSSDTFDRLTREEIDRELAPLPDRLAGPAWQQLARWAFEHRDSEILERAFEIFLEFPGHSMSQARWQRVSLMHRLLGETASSRDVRDYLCLVTLRPQLREFRSAFWPLCQAQGLVDSELEELLAQRERAILAGNTEG